MEANKTGTDAATLPNVGGIKVTFAICQNLITGGFLTLEHLIFTHQMSTMQTSKIKLTSIKMRI